MHFSNSLSDADIKQRVFVISVELNYDVLKKTIILISVTAYAIYIKSLTTTL